MGWKAGRWKRFTSEGIFIVIPSLEEWPTKAKEASSPHEVRRAPLDTNPVFQNLGGSEGGGGNLRKLEKRNFRECTPSTLVLCMPTIVEKWCKLDKLYAKPFVRWKIEFWKVYIKSFQSKIKYLKVL